MNGFFVLLCLKGDQTLRTLFLRCTGQSSFPFSWKTNDVITLRKALDAERAVLFFYNGFLPLLNFPEHALLLSVPQSPNGELRYRQKGDKNRRSAARTVIAPLWGKTHIPGNLSLPASSLLTPASLLSSYLTGWGASLAWSKVTEERRRRRGFLM